MATNLSGDAGEIAKLKARVLRAELALAVQRAVTSTAMEGLKRLRTCARSDEARTEIQDALAAAVQAGRDKAEELSSTEKPEEASDDDFY
jgi:hypothetical protein